MRNAYSQETAHTINGVNGRLYARHLRPDKPNLFSAQKWTSEGRAFPRGGYGPNAKIHAVIRFDDECKNGRASFSIIASVSNASRRDDNGTIGCDHESIAKHFPELSHLIKWHLTATDGPWGYIGNTVYHASDRDHYGLLVGETRQIRNGRTGELCWTLEAVNAPGVAISTTPTGDKYRSAATVPLFILGTQIDGDAEKLPPIPALQWVPWNRVGEGKARDLDAARRAAVWPDATDEQLTADKATLTATLEERLPALLAQFRADMESAGLLWEPKGESV